MVGSATYKDKEISWVLEMVLKRMDPVAIQDGFQEKFKRFFGPSQLRYVKNKYGKDARFNCPLMNRLVGFEPGDPYITAANCHDLVPAGLAFLEDDEEPVSLTEAFRPPRRARRPIQDPTPPMAIPQPPPSRSFVPLNYARKLSISAPAALPSEMRREMRADREEYEEEGRAAATMPMPLSLPMLAGVRRPREPEEDEALSQPIEISQEEAERAAKRCKQEAPESKLLMPANLRPPTPEVEEKKVSVQSQEDVPIKREEQD
ncbi:hypothetical protein HIM_03155 [Hirsutella minnesotensis 3608]|nr:hypothetical protein HIM_03155 [Hirsutella minnesotensis 3608]